MSIKNSGSGPKWVVKPENLFATLTRENQIKTELLKPIQALATTDEQNQPLLQEISQAIETWFKLYQAVILLVAGTNPPTVHPVNTPEEGSSGIANGWFVLENSHLLPALADEEDGNSESGLQFEQLINDFQEAYNSGNLASRFIKENNAVQPIFERRLAQYQPMSPENFTLRRQEIMARCQASILQASFHHSYSDQEVQAALSLINDLWGEQLADHLPELNEWKNRGAVAKWWTEQLANPALQEKIGAADKQTRLGQIAAIVHLNNHIFNYIENRLAYPDDQDISHGLTGIIAKYGVLDGAWSELLSLTCGAIAWQILHQAQVAVLSVGVQNNTL